MGRGGLIRENKDRDKDKNTKKDKKTKTSNGFAPSSNESNFPAFNIPALTDCTVSNFHGTHPGRYYRVLHSTRVVPFIFIRKTTCIRVIRYK
jgi:hypothetical protein